MKKVELNEVFVYQQKIIVSILLMLLKLLLGLGFMIFHFNIYTQKKTLFTYFPISGIRARLRVVYIIQSGLGWRAGMDQKMNHMVGEKNSFICIDSLK